MFPERFSGGVPMWSLLFYSTQKIERRVNLWAVTVFSLRKGGDYVTNFFVRVSWCDLEML